jgi:coenzyme PQQ biosynthesis protein C
MGAATIEFVGHDSPLSTAQLRAALEEVGREQYHHRHPFHLRMHEGKLSRGQMQAWALNRYWYQSRIPIKDAIILSRSEDADFRRAWRQRIEDHDGSAGSISSGGIERWLRLAEATGLDPERVRRGNEILPGVRFAVDAYLDLVRHRSLLEAVASSLTELFAGKLIALRMDALHRHYPWMEGGLSYFENRLSQAPRDAQFAFDWVCRNASTRAEQELAIAALRSKCEILWAQLDALYFAYVEPGFVPQGAFRAEAA